MLDLCGIASQRNSLPNNPGLIGPWDVIARRKYRRAEEPRFYIVPAFKRIRRHVSTGAA